MPQVRCPNCGYTINLENRKETDFRLIKSAAKQHPRTFTDLLHVTKLSRKTLNLRLRELCANGVLTKEGRFYKLNGFAGDSRNSDFAEFSKVFQNKKLRTGLMLIALLLFSWGSGYVLALFTSLPNVQTNKGPEIIGNFAMVLKVNDITDLYAWQVAIAYNSSQMKVLEVTPGDFVGGDFPFFVNSTDSAENLLLIGSSMKGDENGKNGSGTLATITFGYYTEDHDMPQIVFNDVFGTMLLNSRGETIPIEGSTLMLAMLEKS
ncbi:MAG: cohesin domain-containing protein [Candidatus Bathyarchaeales archaeon]